MQLNGSTIGDHSGAALDLQSLASASGIDTGLAVDASGPSVSGDVVRLDAPAGSSLTLTGNEFAMANLGLLAPPDLQHGTPGMNILDAAGPNALALQNGLGTVPVIDTASASTVVVGDGDDLFYAGASNALIVGGTGDDTVVASAGNDTIALGNGANHVFLGSGNSVVYSEGADLVQAGSGHDTVSVGGGHATINGGYGASTLAVDDSAGTATTINVSTGATIQGSGSSVTTINAYGDATVRGGAGGTLYNEQNGTLKFVGVGGSITVTGGAAAGNDTLYGASGANIVLSSQAHDNVFVANDPSYCDGGNVTLNGAMAGGGNQFWAGSGNATLIGGSGGDTLVGGAGHSTLVGGTGSAANCFDLFAGACGSSTEVTIENFDANPGNTMTLFDFGQAATASSLRNATQTDAGTTLHLANGATITLDGVTKNQLTTQNVWSTDPNS